MPILHDLYAIAYKSLSANGNHGNLFRPREQRTMARQMNKADVHAFFAQLHAINPEPKGELDYVNDFTLLVAVVLSAQATDKGVNKATKALFQIADTPEKMVALGLEGIISHVKTIGLYNAKAKNVLALSEMLIRDYRSQVPTTREELVKLPGVGRKTANVVLNIAFGQHTHPVDTHVFRVGNRTGIATGKNELAVEKKLEKIVPETFGQHAHHWLILHGRYICKARTPDCGACPVTTLCRYKDKTA